MNAAALLTCGAVDHCARGGKFYEHAAHDVEWKIPDNNSVEATHESAVLMLHMAPNSDSISLYSLALAPNIGLDHWGRRRPQPVLLTLHARTCLAPAGCSDNVADSIHYGHLSQAMFDLQAATKTFPSLINFAEAAADAALSPQFAADEVHVLAEAPKLLLQAHSLAVELVKSLDHPPQLSVHIKELSLHTIIGVNTPERHHKQLVVTTISFLDPKSSTLGYIFPHGTIVDHLTEVLPSPYYSQPWYNNIVRIAYRVQPLPNARSICNISRPCLVLPGRHGSSHNQGTETECRLLWPLIRGANDQEQGFLST